MTADGDTAPNPAQPPTFAHASEAEFARILDFYEVRWTYEPTVFPTRWSLDGDVVESFSPDFYLPDLDLYVELTTLRQRLVRKKNRKLRRLRELYPDVRIKLFYARDFRALMLKYGKLALADGLSGTVGQVGPRPERPVDDLSVAGPVELPPAMVVSETRTTSRRDRQAASAPAVESRRADPSSPARPRPTREATLR